MKTVKYKFSQEFTYHGLSRWLTSYAVLEPGDDPEQSAIKLMEQSSKIIAEAVKKQAGEEPVIQQTDTISDELQAVLDGINACTEIEGDNGLKSFWMSSKKNLKLVDAYNTKLKQLKNAAGKE